ncbi:MarR family winged helix-turn-helix transcriptional regulator [Cellulomonas wangsupingiae]|uniref:MarR family winged helix-turn-helix transcriptional regulator n=1 Tax=Cellulomonas wangsupingiae TaxID=2968085 RepID=UPI001D0E6E36|nr:MarR family winged helix-turn-helix transcriptional regulator [Cellulomonas wangsupingiae]MCM0640012.1 MarR family winged helix-turn-helix transcriptional regulator [Cellulomonas wangsupingiae]
MDDRPAPADGISLETMLCFDLYSASRAMTAVYRRELDPLDLTYPQYLVLVVLWTRGEQTVRQVIDRLYLDYGTVSPLLKRLEVRGLVERRRRPDDERSVSVVLTPAGEALRERVAHLPAHVGEAFGLAPDEMAELARLLGAVKRHAAGADPLHGARTPARPA